jgi:hypothetical protein
MPFTCSICGEESIRICARCTKDSCNNHICEKCLRCSDCCECEVSLSETWHEAARPVVRSVLGDTHLPPLPDPDPEPEPHLPEPDPDPAPVPGDGPIMP